MGRQETSQLREPSGMVLEGFPLVLGDLGGGRGGVRGRGMDLALPGSPADLETNKKLPGHQTCLS